MKHEKGFSDFVVEHAGAFFWLIAAYIMMLIIAVMILDSQSSSTQTSGSSLVSGGSLWVSLLLVFPVSMGLGVFRASTQDNFKMESITGNFIGWMLQAVMMGVFWPFIEMFTQVKVLDEASKRWKTRD